MGLSKALGILASTAASPLIVGWAGVAYRDHSTVSRTRSATVESVGHEETTAERANRLRQEVAEILDLMLSPATPKVRVTTC